MVGSPPEPIPFSLTWRRQPVDGTVAIQPQISAPDVVVIDLELAGQSLSRATLTQEGALDLALRLIEAVMKRRRQRESEIECVERWRSTVG
jgi:hypothetical protein